MLRLASASVLAILSSAAVAADFPTMSPPPAPMLSTTPIAYNWSGFYIGGHGGWGFGDGAFDDGFIVGGQLGVNWQFNSFVLGAEGDGSFVDWGDTDAVGTVRLRGGIALDRFLPYVTGGAAFGDDIGWVAGGGVDFALTDSISAGVEFLHYDYDEDSSNVIRGRVNVMFNSLFGM
jgi:outer membrane immunogenic protein